MKGTGPDGQTATVTEINLGTLSLGDEIGRGGFGTVYRATLTPFEHEFAVKLLDPHPFQSEISRARERFMQEAKILMALRDPSIISIYGVGEHEAQPYILMEYFAGWNLNSVREKRGSPPPEIVLGFIEKVAGALGYAHSPVRG